MTLLYKVLDISYLLQNSNTEQNFMFINLIFGELAVSLCGIPLDFAGSVTQGIANGQWVCPVQGFIHTFLGRYK